MYSSGDKKKGALEMEVEVLAQKTDQLQQGLLQKQDGVEKLKCSIQKQEKKTFDLHKL